MRILFVSHSRKDPNGGASRVYHLLEEGLSARGHTVKALHYENLGIPPATDRIVSRLLMPQAASRRAAREPLHEFDVVMSSSGMLYPLFRKLRQQRPRPLLVSHLHGLSFFDNQATLNEAMRGHMKVSRMFRHVTGPLTIKWDREGSRFADVTVVQNGRDLDYLREQGVSSVVSIPLSVHPEILLAGASTPAAQERDPDSLLWFGSWVERKGRHYLPRAFQMIVEQYPAVRLTVGGTGLPPHAVQQAFPADLRARITVLPRISLAEQIEAYKRHAVFLYPSLSEGFGFALLEAMAMGLAAVTTGTGLAGDFLTDRQHAMIVPAASALHLAQSTITLLGDAGLRCRIAQAGQTLAQSFSTDSTVTAYEQLFQEYRAKQKGTDS